MWVGVFKTKYKAVGHGWRGKSALCGPSGWRDWRHWRS